MLSNYEMSSCRLLKPLSVSTEKEPLALEDYFTLIDMERSSDSDNFYDENEDDVYSQLEQKEKDLVLAAELGKALLEKNGELTRLHEQTVEDYNSRIEGLEQERYHLKLRLDNVSGEYDNMVRELQWDLTQLRQQMEDQQQQSQESEKDKCMIIRELTQQNERLNDQLRKTTSSEAELTNQVQGLRDQLSNRRTSMHDHIHQLEVLQEEINLLTQRTHELERRIAVVTEERDALSCSLEESQDRILMLGKQNHEQELQLRLKGRDIEELQASNSQLVDQVENISQRVSSTDFNQSQNLFSELSQLSDSTDIEMASKSPMFQSYPNQPHVLFETDWNNDVDIECDDSFMAAMSSSSHDSEHFQGSPTAECELRKELLDAYRHLQCLCRDLRSREVSPDKDSELDDCPMVQAGQLVSLIAQLRELIHLSLQQREGEENESRQVEDLKIKMGELEATNSVRQQEVVKLTRQVQLKDEDLKQQSAQLSQFMEQLKSHHSAFSELETERDRLQDSLLGEINADDVLNQTRAEREMARKQRDEMELELAQTKMDVLSLNNQLLEAIQQKVELSEKLDQWEVDMHEVLGLQMQKRIEEDTVREKAVAELALKKQDDKPIQKKGFFNFSRH